MIARCLLLAAVAATLTTACAASTSGGGGDADKPSDRGATESLRASDIDPALVDLVELARHDLADHLDVPEENITVVSAQPVTWSDASLGCPQPGMRYAQVVTEGSRIVLRHDDRTYDYHAGEGRPEPFLCDAAVQQHKSPGPTIDRTVTGD